MFKLSLREQPEKHVLIWNRGCWESNLSLPVHVFRWRRQRRRRRGGLTDGHAGAFVCRTRRRRDAADGRQQRDEDQRPKKQPHLLLLFLQFLHLVFFFFFSCFPYNTSFSFSNSFPSLSLSVLCFSRQTQLSSSSSNSPVVLQYSSSTFVAVVVVVLVLSVLWGSAVCLGYLISALPASTHVLCWWNPDVCVCVCLWVLYVYLCGDQFEFYTWGVRTCCRSKRVRIQVRMRFRFSLWSELFRCDGQVLGNALCPHMYRNTNMCVCLFLQRFDSGDDGNI